MTPKMPIAMQASEKVKRRAPAEHAREGAEDQQHQGKAVHEHGHEQFSLDADGFHQAQYDGQHNDGGNGPLPRLEALPRPPAEKADIEEVADEEGGHADQKKNIARGHKKDVARAAEELRRDEKPRRP